MTDKIALFDMDGTLFDHDGALRRDMLAICSPYEIHHYEIKTCNFHDLGDIPHMRKRIDFIRERVGWWKNLHILQTGLDIYHAAKNIGFFCKILTKGPSSKPQAWTEKVECIHKYFGQSMPVDIVGADKGGTYGRVLVDDYPDYVEKWLKNRPRGLVIMPDQPYNKHYTHPNLIRYNGDNLDEIKQALTAAFDRNREEH